MIDRSRAPSQVEMHRTLAGLGRNEDLIQRSMLTDHPLPVQLPEVGLVRAVSDAERMFDAIQAEIEMFEATLQPNQEIGGRLVSSAGVTFHMATIEHFGDTIVMRGTHDGSPVALVQHYTQVSVLLVALPAQSQPPARIGFLRSDEG